MPLSEDEISRRIAATQGRVAGRVDGPERSYYKELAGPVKWAAEGGPVGKPLVPREGRTFESYQVLGLTFTKALGKVRVSFSDSGHTLRSDEAAVVTIYEKLQAAAAGLPDPHAKGAGNASLRRAEERAKKDGEASAPNAGAK